MCEREIDREECLSVRERSRVRVGEHVDVERYRVHSTVVAARAELGGRDVDAVRGLAEHAAVVELRLRPLLHLLRRLLLRRAAPAAVHSHL